MNAVLKQRTEVQRREILERETARLAALYITIHDVGGGMAAVIRATDQARNVLGAARREALTTAGWIV